VNIDEDKEHHDHQGNHEEPPQDSGEA
jgi:hypothetical protein